VNIKQQPGMVCNKTYPPKAVANHDPVNKTKSAIAVKENIVLTPQIHIIANNDGKDGPHVPGLALDR